ncbi:carbohydrate ABC transporter permease [Microbacterium sp. Bi98]|uniref:carbohydrate ABC transporter permease n=1 Tax=Microbacterium sp. Bi98 TaxID=2821116 RepID=UPI001E47691C|nr:carbohydrate ABC transporter permease [Microbacterium sp. Bi98]
MEIALIIAGLIFLIPLLVLVAVALQTPGAPTNPFGFSWPLNFGNFSTAWTESGMGPAMLNSVVITTITVFLVIVLSSTAAYTITRITRRWSRGVFYAFLVGFLLPGQLAVVPLYLQFSSLGVVGSIVPVILIDVSSFLPFAIFLYSAFLRDLPKDYEEAARIDGAVPWRIFVTVVFPLLRPITGTIIILSALSTWNDFFNPLLYLTGSENSTAPLTVYSFVGQYSAQWPLVFCALIISIIPILIAYFFMQRFIIRGFASGLKG